MVISNSVYDEEDQLNDDIPLSGRYIQWIYTSPETLPLQSISELSTNHRKQRFHKKSTKPAFTFQDKQSFMFDCYHIPSQFKAYNDLTNDNLSNFITNSLELLIKLSHKVPNLQNHQVCLEFADPSFIDSVKFQSDSRLKNTEDLMNMDKSLQKKKHKLMKYLKIKRNFMEMVQIQQMSQTAVCKALKISRRFYQYSRELLEKPNLIHQIEYEIKQSIAAKNTENMRFVEFFKNNNIKYKTKATLFRKFKELHKDVEINSLSEFDRRFVKRNRISYQKCKLKYNQRNEEHKEPCRVLFIKQLLESIDRGDSVYFFDETTFEINSKSFFCYGFVGQRPETNVNMKPIYLRLLLIVSLKNIEAAVFSFDPVNGTYIFNFLRQFAIIQQNKKDYSCRPTILIMDNAPKNRTQKIKDLSNEKFLNIMYTVPCSPFTNFIESVFNKIKQVIQNHEMYPFKLS